MGAIFISHSSEDNNTATEFQVLLEKQGYRSVFLDFNPELGIPAGRDWEQELYAQLRASEAVIVLCSAASMQSNWCFAEITHAKALGKQVFPVKVGDCVINTVLTSRQVLDMTQNTAEDVYRRLWRGLKIAGLDPASSFEWDGKRPPYPGLMAFEENDAAIFFGREPEIQKGLELLNRIRQFGGARMVVVLGSSGSGKSSLVKAGIVPRLRRDEERWQVVPPFRPGTDPLRELSVSLAEALQRNRAGASADGIHDLLKTPNPATAAEALVQVANELRIAAGHRDATVVLVIDQLEELLTYGTAAGAQHLLPVLEAALNAPGSPLMVISTLRSDFLGDLQLHPAARTLAVETLQLGPMPRERLFKVIEGPAELSGLRLEPGLTQGMIEDTETNDALPLLAFTLRELYEKFGGDKLLKLEEYREGLGGLSGSVAKAAESVYQAKPLSAAQQADLRHAFRTLVRVNEEGKYVRQPASRSELPASVRDILERFVQARLLVAGGEGDQQIVEVAHEALFRSWDRLRLWLDEDRELLLWQQRLHRAAGEWERTSRDSGALLRGASLAEAERHFKNDPGALHALDREYIEKSVEQRQGEQEERERARTERERVQKRNNRVLSGFLAFAVVLTAGALWQWRSAHRAESRATHAKQETEIVLKTVLGDSAMLRSVGAHAITASWEAGAYLPPWKPDNTSGNYLQGVRALYTPLSKILDLNKLSVVSSVPIFVGESPHQTSINYKSHGFGHYNPAFVRWAGDNLLPAAADANLRAFTTPFYNSFLREMARNYYLTHKDLVADEHCRTKLAAGYKDAIDTYAGKEWSADTYQPLTPGNYLVDQTQHYSAAVEGAGKKAGRGEWSTPLSPYFATVAVGFWLRRDMDGTSEGFRRLLEELLTVYDSTWLNSQAPNLPRVPIECDEAPPG